MLRKIIYGLSDDAVLENLSKERVFQWARPQIEGIPPCSRGGHTATLHENKIYFFGGHHYEGEKEGFLYYNDVHILDIDNNSWTKAKCKGVSPEKRYGHSACAVGKRIIFFGGKGENNKFFRSLHALDTSNMTWYDGPASGGAPSARSGHSCVVHNVKLYIFGGVTGKRFLDDLYSFDLSSMAWNRPSCIGIAPSKRYNHAAHVVGDLMIVHGGFCLPDPQATGASATAGTELQKAYLNDMKVLDLKRYVWSSVDTRGSPPEGLYGHSIAFSEKDMIVFGGWKGMAKTENNSSFFNKEGLQEPVKKYADGTGSVSYCMTLRSCKMEWELSRFIGLPPCNRYGHTCTSVGPHLIVFGGWGEGKALSDLVVLRDRTYEVNEETNTPVGTFGAAMEVEEVNDTDDKHTSHTHTSRNGTPSNQYETVEIDERLLKGAREFSS